MEGESHGLEDARLGREPVAGIKHADGGAIVVHLQGELDLFNADPLREALFAAAAEGPARLVVDLAEVSFVDSTALGVLIEASARVGPPGATAIAAPSVETRRALEVSGLDRHFTVCDTVEQALA